MKPNFYLFSLPIILSMSREGKFSLLVKASHFEMLVSCSRSNSRPIRRHWGGVLVIKGGLWGWRRPAAPAPRSPAPGLHLRTCDEVRRFAWSRLREGLADFCTRLCCSGWASARAARRPKPNLRKCPRNISTKSLSVYVWSRCYTSCTVVHIHTTWAPAGY